MNRPQRERAIGIDVGADAAWLVALDPYPVVACRLCHPVDPAVVTDFCEGAAAVAIDAPGGFSSLSHLEDLRLAPKFRRARCSEVALARIGIRVPWVTPPEGDPAVPGWMRTGFAIWSALESVGHRPLETYPHAVLWRLAGRPILHKQRPLGALARLEALACHVRLPPHAAMWSHDAVDALAAAFVACGERRGSAERVSCEDDGAWPTHDGSCIWLPPASAIER